MTLAVIGAGNRARKYLSCLPEGVKVGYLVEPEEIRLRQTAARYGVPPEHCYARPEAFFAEAHPDIDAVIVAAPDALHVPIARACVGRGWHVLLEKPAAPSEAEFLSLLDASEKAGIAVSLCLEMRFHPYFRRIRELAQTLGPIREIDHIEHIGPDRMAHTFVRGLWSRSEDAGPIFLSKCCHDADFILWMTGARLDGPVRSTGSLTHFHPECAPEGAAERCIDCPLQEKCRYSAVDLYRRRREWTAGFDIPEGSSLATVIEEELRSGRYGRCVYHCDNDVYDTQQVEVRLTGGIDLRLRLEGTSSDEGRSIVIRADGGTLYADRGRIRVIRHGAAPQEEDFTDLANAPLHAGADRALVEEFFSALQAGRIPTTTLASALEGHRLCYQAG